MGSLKNVLQTVENLGKNVAKFLGTMVPNLAGERKAGIFGNLGGTRGQQSVVGHTTPIAKGCGQ